MADQVLLMRQGRIEQDGPPAELYERPATIFTARFVGTPPMNVLPATVLGPMSAESRSRPLPQVARPTRLASACERKRRGSHRRACRRGCDAVEYLGADTLVDTRIGEEAFHACGVPAGRLGRRWRTGVDRMGCWRDALVRCNIGPEDQLGRSGAIGPQTRQWEAVIMKRRAIPEGHGGRSRRADRQAGDRPERHGDFLLLSGRRRRADHQADRHVCGRLREGEPEHQGEADLRRHLPGDHRQGADRAQERQPADDFVLLSTDMFTLIDEDAIVPIDDFIKTDDDKAWLKSFFPAFMLNSQTGGKTWGAPFQRSTVVLYWNKDLFKEAGLDPDKAPATWAEQVAFAQKLTKADGSGRRHAMGHPGAVLGLPLLAVPGLHDAGRCRPHERGGQPDVLRQARGGRGADLLGRPVPQAQGASAPASSNGARRPRTSSRRRRP